MTYEPDKRTNNEVLWSGLLTVLGACGIVAVLGWLAMGVQ